MDAYEATRVVFSRIQALDPDNAAEIMGILLIQDHGEKEMIRLAFGPEPLLNSVISKARTQLGLLSPKWTPPPLNISSPSWAPPTPEELAGPDDHLSYLYSTTHQHHRSRSCTDNDVLFGWKPCLYFARGYCKNGMACKFLHVLPEDVTDGQDQLLRSKSQRMMSSSPYSPIISPSCQRAATRLDHADFAGLVNPVSRQIYLTFPADSAFREEDVSDYFSIYGTVQDVRIPYQQKRMFGFVTFVYPETVKLILAKGNPHFVCDARVLVKPYKERGRTAEKSKQGERGESSPLGMDYDLQQLGARMQLRQAIEMQQRRLMGLQLMDFKSRSFNRSIHNNYPYDQSSSEDKSPSPASSGEELLLNPVNTAAADKEEANPNEDSQFQESVEHNLPDSPFASPTKASAFDATDSWTHLDMSSLKSCLFQMPRFSSGHGAVGL